MLQTRNLNVTMKKDLRDLLRDFTFALNPGDKAAIIGEEGNGKSTLLKLLYDPALVEEYVEYSGAIQKDGMVLGYLSQELPEEDRDKTAYEFCCGEEAFLDSSPKEVAEAAAVSQRHLERVFFEVCGLSPMAYLLELRLRHASLLLRGTSKTVAEIAGECGFEDPSYFARVFKRKYGAPPNQCRNAKAL